MPQIKVLHGKTLHAKICSLQSHFVHDQAAQRPILGRLDQFRQAQSNPQLADVNLGLAVAQFDVGNGSPDAGHYLPIEFAFNVDLIAGRAAQLGPKFCFESLGVAQ